MTSNLVNDIATDSLSKTDDLFSTPPPVIKGACHSEFEERGNPTSITRETSQCIGLIIKNIVFNSEDEKYRSIDLMKLLGDERFPVNVVTTVLMGIFGFQYVKQSYQQGVRLGSDHLLVCTDKLPVLVSNILQWAITLYRITPVHSSLLSLAVDIYHYYQYPTLSGDDRAVLTGATLDHLVLPIITCGGSKKDQTTQKNYVNQSYVSISAFYPDRDGDSNPSGDDSDNSNGDDQAGRGGGGGNNNNNNNNNRNNRNSNSNRREETTEAEFTDDEVKVVDEWDQSHMDPNRPWRLLAMEFDDNSKEYMDEVYNVVLCHQFGM